ncbi:G-type lectin S-receptor-like serine/threonine-protein kinase RLK1 [Bienertia sinuspersici]
MVWQLFCTIPLLTLILIQSLSISAQNICRYQTEFGNGICGFNSICSLDDSQRPTCRCPEGYTLQDPNNTNGSCVPNFNLSVCGKHGQGDVKADYKLLRHNNTNFPTGDYSKVQPSTEEDCKNSCLNDCLCVAIHFNAQSRNCWKKRFPLANGVTGPDVNGTMYLKVAKGNITNNPVNPLYPISSPGEVKYKKNDALLALMGSSICVNLILLTVIIFGLIFMYKKKHSRLFDDCQSRTLNEYSNVHSFSYKELEDATDGFKKEIGRGLQGKNWKGKFSYYSCRQKTHHKNLVRFIGFCKEEDQRLLVYEYMSNGTVADYLFGDLRPSWTARIEIAHGISRGLLYLHEECSTQIIHCDIKPQNVLLDEYYNPRISDFGLAKLLVLNQTHTNTAIRGTKGYLAPEWFRNKPVTSKVDVYSFGVLLLEIISCRRSICMDISEEQAILTDWAFDCFQSNTLESLVSDDTEALNDMERLERFVMVALWCIQEDPSLRPPMKKATQMLEAAGQFLTATRNSSPWQSPSKDFAFGFQQYPNNSNNLYLLAIWYVKIPNTIVWCANDGNPVPQGSSVKITADKGLVLSDPQGTILWNITEDLSGSSVDYGFMNDTGNFLLKDSSSNDPVWQSFDHPTDTLLPTQNIKAGTEVDSRQSETNFTKGRFQLRLLSDGNLVLNTRDLVTGFAYGAYYETGTNYPEKPENAGDKVTYDESGEFYVHTKNGSRVDLTPANNFSAKNYYQRITLNFDGILTSYYHPKTFSPNKEVSWSKIQSLPDNICMSIGSYGNDLDSGVCGYNSICSIGDDQRPRCQCPQGYVLMDPNDKYSSCKQDFTPDICDPEHVEGTVKEGYNLVPLRNTDWPFADYAKLEPISEEECKSSCRNDCFCAAAIFKSPTCWKKKLPLSSGRHDSRVDRTAWLKVGNGNDSDYPVIPREKEKDKRNRIFEVLFGGSVCVNFLLLTAMILGIFFVYNKRHSKLLDDYQRSKTLREYSNVHSFSYKELEEATNGFKEEIGRGAFGMVYKGRVGAGTHPTIVAVKKLDRIFKEADKEFSAEVNVIGQTHHKNLVRFIGFCKEEDQRLLVYEYMSNGTVADYLFGDLRPSWTARIEIAHGISRGLLYLHEECSTQIIHCDIKPQNVLLDDYYNARIADFGLAKLLVLNQTHTNTAVRGTKGYLAPEWFRNKPVTVKVDVYSFGVMLLEIICCRRSIRMDISEERAILTDWAFDCYQSNTLESLVSDDMEALNNMLQLKRFVMIALWCIQEDPTLRPTMKKATQMLEGVSEVASPPCPTSFSITTQP